MKRLSLVVAASLIAFTSSVYADNLKIGVVNMEEVVQKSTLAISYNDKISKDFKPRQDALNDVQKKLQDEMDQLNYNSYKLSQADRAKLQTSINTDKRNFDVMSVSLQKDLANAQSQYTQALMGKLNTIVAKLAQDGHYDMIQTNNGILYLNTTIDLTPQVIDQLK
jgi:outer membrane protein